MIKKISLMLIMLILAPGLSISGGDGCWVSMEVLTLPNDGTGERWGPWTFDYGIDPEGLNEGLVIKNVRYNGHLILQKGSMPVVRVKYRGTERDISSGCGPYSDRINLGHVCIVRNSLGRTTQVTKRFFWDVEGRPTAMEIGILAHIGGYSLFQTWIFSSDRAMEARLYSGGWSCDLEISDFLSGRGLTALDHRHHAYWMLDFDMGTSESNRIWEYRGEAAFTPTYPLYEGMTTTLGLSSNPVWVIYNSELTHPLYGLHVVFTRPESMSRSDPFAEFSDPLGPPWYGFSRIDAAWRRWRSEEASVGWEFPGELEYDYPAESVVDTDIVVWAVGHLTHILGPHDNPGLPLPDMPWHGARIAISVYE